MKKQAFARAGVLTVFIVVALWLLLGPERACSLTRVSGTVRNISMKARTIQLQGAEGVRIIRFDEATGLVNLANAKKIKPGMALTISYEARGSAFYAIEIEAQAPVQPAPGVEIRAGELRKLLAEGTESPPLVLVDARPPERFAEGHLPGAVNVFPGQFDEQKSRLPENRNALLVFYCGGPRCGLASSAAALAQKKGYTDIRVYTAGEPDWRRRKLPLYSTPEFVNETMKAGTGIIVVDGRSSEEIQRGHVPGAVSVPFGRIGDAEDDFPSDRKAPVVVYGADRETSEADAAARVIRNWGYERVTVMAGGLAAWADAGLEVVPGPATCEIRYARRPFPGEISAEEFKHLAVSRPSGVFLVDCREPDEFESGHIPGALNVPLSGVDARTGELPKDALVVTYCNTGARAEMLYHVLTKSGFRAVFLNRELSIEEDGSFDVED